MVQKNYFSQVRLLLSPFANSNIILAVTLCCVHKCMQECYSFVFFLIQRWALLKCSLYLGETKKYITFVLIILYFPTFLITKRLQGSQLLSSPLLRS